MRSVSPSKLPEVNREGDGGEPAGCRRSATHAQRNAVRHPDGQGHDRLLVRDENSLVRLEDEIVFELRAALGIAAGSGYRELRRGIRLDLEIEIQGHGNGVKARAQIG